MGTKIETKSDHEWKAVRNIYDNKRHTIIGIDRPDFNITRIHDQYCTGAEITRFYFHQASARLKNKTKYVDEVLKGNMHPDDRMHLSSDTIEILGRKDNRGNPISFDGILYNHPNIQDIQQLLYFDITKKNDKYHRPDGSLRKIELIITDEENCFAGWTIDEFSSSIYKSDVLNSIIQFSIFNEIYLITNLSQSNKVIPLKRTLFLYRLFIFCSYYFQQEKKQISTLPPFILLLFKLLNRLGYISIKAFRDNEESYYIFYELCQVKITPTNVGFRIIEYDEMIDELQPLNLEAATIANIVFDFSDFSNYTASNFTNLQNFIMDPCSA